MTEWRGKAATGKIEKKKERKKVLNRWNRSNGWLKKKLGPPKHRQPDPISSFLKEMSATALVRMFQLKDGHKERRISLMMATGWMRRDEKAMGT